uniref:F-box domain-containing protein n=2 Tax=Quercus lobata TaxID=97700 RepID=A0A7N2N077_QUELO
MADWSQLPQDLLHLIAKRLKTRIDLFRLRSICSSWRSSISLPPKQHRHTPIPTTVSTYPNTPFISSNHNNKGLPQNAGWSRTCSSSYRNVWSPPWRSRPVVEVDKIALMCVGPENNDFALVTPHRDGGGLAFFNSRIQQWITIGSHPATSSCIAVTHFEGKFYAVDTKGRTISLDQFLDSKVVTNLGSDAYMKYLVEAGGELLVVEAYIPFPNAEGFIGSESYRGLCIDYFEVSKLNKEGGKWVKVNSLGDWVLFLGIYSSFSVLASELPGCKRNCIVVTQPRWKEFNLDGHDTNVVELESGRSGPLENYPDFSKLLFFPGGMGTSSS